MAYINVAEWTSENVAEWLGGLDDAILPYAHFFINNQIDGRHLLTLLPDDLKNLNITKIGHQEIILDAVDLLRQLHYTLTTETLQSIALRVGCKARSLYNELKRNGPKECPENKGAKQERVSCNILASVSDILVAVKAFISWLDRYPFDGEARYIPVRKSLLTLSIELASTAQRDQFAEKPHDIIKTSALNLAELCDQIIQEFNDSLIIQPASLDIITVKRKLKEEWGIHIHSTYNGVHIVGGVKHQSPSHRCGKVEIGDEIIQVNYQTVVGWQLKKLVYAMSEHATDVHLTLKKRPRHSNLSGQVIVMKPYRIPCRKTALARLHKWSDSNCSLNIQEGGYNSNKAPIATHEVEDDDDSAFLPDKNAKSLAVPQTKALPTTNGNCVEKPLPFVSKSRATVQRRATVSGASPVQTRAPVSIEELVIHANSKSPSKELVGRSVSHDPRKHSMGSGMMTQPSLSFLKHLSSLQAADENEELCQNNSNVDKASLENNNRTKQSSSQINPPMQDACNSGMSASGSDGDSGIADEKASTCSSNFPVWKRESKMISQPLQGDNSGAQLHLKKLMDQISSPNSTPPPSSPVRKQSSSSSIASSNISDNVFIGMKGQSEQSKMVDEENIKPNSYSSKERKYIFQSPLLRKKHFHGRYVSRRVSCKDLGQGDCQGWLYKRKDGKRLFSGPKWTKKWVVLKKQYLYCFQDKDDIRADCLVFLPGFAVSPASDCKAKKYAFKLHSPSASFLFASENVSDMTKWMNKMGLAAISYPSSNTIAEVYFSETEDESDSDAYNNSSDSKSKSSSSTSSQAKYNVSSLGTPKSTSSSVVEKSDAVKALASSQKGSSTFAGKINFPKPSSPLSVSPRKTVAEKPLEKSCPEPESYRRKDSSTCSPVYQSKALGPNRHSGNWISPPEHNSPLIQQRAGSGFAASGDTVAAPCNVTSPQFRSEINQQSLPRSNQTYKSTNQSPLVFSNKAPALPSRSKPQMMGNQSISVANMANQSPLIGWKNNSRSSPAVCSMLRCSSLQKLNNSESWPVETKDANNSNQAEALHRQKEFVSVLDREYRRLYGDKKPETISPKHVADEDNHCNQDSSGRSPTTWWGNHPNVNVVRSATSQQIRSLYTRDCWKESDGNNLQNEEKSRSVSVSSDSGSSNNPSSAPPLPQRNLGAKFFLSGVNSIGRGNKKVTDDADTISTSSPSTSLSSLTSKNESAIKNSKFSLGKQFSPKSPVTSSSSFRFFSSPKFVRKFTSPKPERKQLMSTATITSPTISHGHLNRINLSTDTNLSANQLNSPKSQATLFSLPSAVTCSASKTQKPERTFLGSPKLARAIFGSPKQTKKPTSLVNTTTTAVQTEHTFDELVRLHQESLTSNQLVIPKVSDSGKLQTNIKVGSSEGLRTSSNSSLNNNASGSALSLVGSSHFYVETRIRPQITISLPLVAESGRFNDVRLMSKVSEEDQFLPEDNPEPPKTPSGLSKPTMGVSMLAKKRSPSASSDLASQLEGKPQNVTSSLNEDSFEEWHSANPSFEEHVEEELERSQRSEITVIINGDTSSKKVESISISSRERDELESLMDSFKELGLSPDGVNIDNRRKQLLSLLSKQHNDMNEQDRITRLVLDFRALQRTLKDHEVEASAIEELLSGPITSEALENWICQYPHLLPPDYC